MIYLKYLLIALMILNIYCSIWAVKPKPVWVAKPKKVQEIALEGTSQIGLAQMPKEIKEMILKQLIVPKDFVATVSNILNFSRVNKQFNQIVNDPRILKDLINLILANTVGWNESTLAKGLANLPGMQSKEMQDWLKKRKDQIPLEQTLLAMVKRPIRLMKDWIQWGTMTEKQVKELTNNIFWTIKKLIELGVNVNARNYTQFNETPLMIATSQGDLELINYLLEQGADVNAQDIEGRNALFYSVFDLQVIQRLLEAGANPDIRDSKGKLFYEFFPNKEQVIELIKSHGLKQK